MQINSLLSYQALHRLISIYKNRLEISRVILILQAEICMSSSSEIFFVDRDGAFKMADVICQTGRLAFENRTMAISILYLLSSETQMTFIEALLSIYLFRHFLTSFNNSQDTMYSFYWLAGIRIPSPYCLSASRVWDLWQCERVSQFTVSPGHRREFSNFFLAHHAPAICILH